MGWEIVHSLSMESLSLLLRAETRDLHEWVEDHPFNQELFSGRMPRTRYARYLSGLRAIAISMEKAVADLEEGSPLYVLRLPVLYRSAALQEDLQHFPPVEEPAPALASFLSAPASPARVAAMAYVRWMGDLGGGQIIVRKLADAWSLEEGPGSGLAFYHFEEPIGSLRSQLRSALDSLPFDQDHQRQTVAAAREVFELHEAWFSSLI